MAQVRLKRKEISNSTFACPMTTYQGRPHRHTDSPAVGRLPECIVLPGGTCHTGTSLAVVVQLAEADSAAVAVSLAVFDHSSMT